LALAEKWAQAPAGPVVDKGEVAVAAVDAEEVLLGVVWEGAVWVAGGVAAEALSAWEPPPIGAII
jgi:hypothetical protein